MSKDRSSNIELLRIVAMLLIVLHHLCKYAYPGGSSIEIEMTRNVLLLGGKIGVDVFVLISGYFLASGKIKITSMLRVLFEAWFYSLTLGIACANFVPDIFVVKDFLKSFLPTNNGLPWFVTAYLGMYLVAPWLSKLGNDLSREQFKSLILLGFCIFSLVPTLTGCMFVTGDFSWFCYLFMVACYIRRFEITAPVSKVLCIGGLSFLIASVLVGELVCLKLPVFSRYVTYFANMYTVPTLTASVGLFCIFKALKVPTIKPINRIAQGAFGVYLIHENVFVRELLWPNFGFVFAGSFLVEILLAVLATLGIYACLSCIDLIRQRLLETPFFKFLQSKLGLQFEKCDNALNGNVRERSNEQSRV